MPLKVFIRCGECDVLFTGYVVKAKGLWYYKCRTKGCKCNKSARTMHKSFEALLGSFSIQPNLVRPLQRQMEASCAEQAEGKVDQQEAYKAALKEVEKKLDAIEEKYYVTGEMAKETFEKFYFRLKGEHATIAKQLQESCSGISNPSDAIFQALTLSLNLVRTWTSSDVSTKEKLQKLVFPDGIIYDRKTRHFEPRASILFSLVLQAGRGFWLKKKMDKDL